MKYRAKANSDFDR